jgi:hypothetical protein
MRKTIVGLLAAAVLAATVGVLYPSSAFAAGVTCSGTPGTLAGSTITGNVTVPSGSWCNIQGQTVNGNVNVSAGAGVVIGSGSTINGNVYAPSGAGSFAGNPCATPGITHFSIVLGSGNHINGSVTASGSASTVIVGGGGCGSETVQRSVTVDANKGAVFVEGNTIGGNAQITNNTPGPVKVNNNHVTGNLTCSGNAAVTSAGNTHGGNISGGQCH